MARRTPERRAWEKAYRQRPHVKERERAYRQREEVKAKARKAHIAYYRRPEVKERKYRYGKKRRLQGDVSTESPLHKRIRQNMTYHHNRLCAILARRLVRGIIRDEADLALMTTEALEEKRHGIRKG